jgi:hypothetical protein
LYDLPASQLLDPQRRDLMPPHTSFAAAALFAAMSLGPVAAQQPPLSSDAQPHQPAQPGPAAQQQGALQQPVAQPPGTQPNRSGQPGPQPAGTSGQTIATVPSATCVPADVSTALPLLDRVQRLLDAAVKDQLGKVELDRADVDEMRAEIAQIRSAIQPIKP